MLTVLERTKFRSLVKPGDTLLYKTEVVSINEAGQPIRLKLDMVSAHLFMNFRVVDEHGRQLGHGRNLGALRAAEEMAKAVGDPAFAATCRALFDKGSKWIGANLFNGEYFIQEVDLKKHPDWQYADGCLADQLFGENRP